MTTATIVGPGNIGTDLLVKLRRGGVVDVRYMVGVDRPPTGSSARGRWASRRPPTGWTGF